MFSDNIIIWLLVCLWLLLSYLFSSQCFSLKHSLSLSHTLYTTFCVCNFECVVGLLHSPCLRSLSCWLSVRSGCEFVDFCVQMQWAFFGVACLLAVGVPFNKYFLYFRFLTIYHTFHTIYIYIYIRFCFDLYSCASDFALEIVSVNQWACSCVSSTCFQTSLFLNNIFFHISLFMSSFLSLQAANQDGLPKKDEWKSSLYGYDEKQ